MTLKLFNLADVTLEVTALESPLQVLELHGLERMSSPFEFRLLLTLEGPALELDQPMLSSAHLVLRGPGSERVIHGVIDQFSFKGVARRRLLYGARLVPALSTLAHRFTSRIFQNLSVPEIVLEVLKDAGLPGDYCQKRLRGSYGPRNYCVQYQESDLAFVQRLLEEEGIYYTFFHSDDSEHMRIMDDRAAITPLPGGAEVVFRDEALVNQLEEECLSHFELCSTLGSGMVTMGDYFFKNPAVPLEVSAAGEYRQLETYAYPGEYVSSSIGQTLARVRLEELEAAQLQLKARGNVRKLEAGYAFDLVGHPYDGLNEQYLIVSIRHHVRQSLPLSESEGAGQWSASPYQIEVEGQLKDRPFRPPRVTARPQIVGLQTARVVGPVGQEIHSDAHGRVKVEFHWDREHKGDDRSSCWVRVSQGWAGVRYGCFMLPRIGQEVLVQFLEGDPDRPVIIGRVYNGDNPPPYALPANQTRSTWKTSSSPGGNGFNELRFEDLAGSEEIYLHGQKDWNIEILHDKSQSIGHDESLQVGNDRSKTVGNDQSETVGNNKSISVGGSHDEQISADKSMRVGGTHFEQIASDKTMMIGGAHTEQISGNKTLSVAGNHSESIAANMSVSVGSSLTETVAINHAHMVGAAMEVVIGGALVEAVGGLKTTSVGGALTETVGALHSLSVMGAQTTSVGGSQTTKVSGDLKASAKSITLTAADQLVLKCGAASIILKSSGEIQLKGTKINVKASGNLILKGAKIGEN